MVRTNSMSSVPTVNSYRKISEFSDKTEYKDYVKSVIRPGVKVRRVNGDCGSVKHGDTGIVTRVLTDRDWEWQKYDDGETLLVWKYDNWCVHAHWDLAGRNICGGWCENMELIQ